MRHKVLRVIFGLSIALSLSAPSFAQSVVNPTLPSASPAPLATVPPLGIDGEACPVRIGSSKTLADNVVTFRLAAHRSRLVAARVEMQTDTGWYAFAVPATPLAVQQKNRHTKDVSWVETRIISQPLYVRLPHGSTKFLRAWVTSAQVLSPSDPWMELGDVACLPSAHDFADLVPTSAPLAKALKPEHDQPDIALSGVPKTDATIVDATPVAAPVYSCAHPFLAARVRTRGRVRVMGQASVGRLAISDVVLTILPSGKIASARIIRPSGSTVLDQAALHAATDSSYEPARVFCQPAPGRYRFRVEFSPGY